ncbi:MAG: hypothetical protein U0Q07_20640 [Acidimicrobiales bacterium]
MADHAHGEPSGAPGGDRVLDLTDARSDGLSGDLAESVDAVAADLRQAFLVDPDPAVAQDHLAAMAAVALDRGSLAPTDGRSGRKAVAAAVVAGAVLLGTAGLAAAGALPAPVQNAAHRLVAPIGIDLPTTADGDGPATTSTTVPPTGGGPTGAAPGASGAAPGPEGTNLGVGGGEPPGLVANGGTVPTDPGASGAAPGQGGVNPGIGGGEAPGQVVDPRQGGGDDDGSGDAGENGNAGGKGNGNAGGKGNGNAGGNGNGNVPSSVTPTTPSRPTTPARPTTTTTAKPGKGKDK